MKQNETLSKGVDWIKIKQEFVTSSVSLRALAKKYGLTPAAVSRRARQENWLEERERYRKELAERTRQVAVEEQAEISKLIFRIGLTILQRFYEALVAEGIQLTPRDAERWANILLAMEQASKASEAQRIVIQWVSDAGTEN